MNLSPKAKAAILLGVIVVATIAVWDTFATYPVQLLVVFVHEVGHALASVLTGGEVAEMVINPNLSGHMQSFGGNGIIVASAGYLTSVLFGAALIMLSSRKNLARAAVGGLGGALVILSLVFARPILSLAFPFGVVFGALLIVAAWKAPQIVNRGALFYLATVSSLYSIADIRSDVLRLSSPGTTDATILQAKTGIPAVVWAVVWALIAAVIMFFAIRYAIRKWS